MRAEDVRRALDEVLSDGARRGAMHNTVEDLSLDGRMITVRGRRLVNFGSCSYLGLELHPSLQAGVIDAVRRYGTQFSSSRAYLSTAAYAEVETALGELFGRHTIVTPSTTLGHQATIPTLVDPRDVLILDHQVHASVQTAAKLAQVQGTRIELIPHSDLTTLERRIREYGRSHHRIWHAIDGLYSMYADFAPIAELSELVARYERFRLYVDDAHGFSWTGQRGRGHALELLSPAARESTVVAGSLNKSFAAAGGAVTFADAESRRQVFTVGGPMIFSGPVQPPMLGAVLASARLHLTGDVEPRRAHLLRLIELFNRLAVERGLPLVSASVAPIRCVGAGTPEVAYRLCDLLQRAGYFVDTATFPGVPAKRSGARVTLTAHHRDEDVVGVVDALATALPAALAAAGSSRQALDRAFGRLIAKQRAAGTGGGAGSGAVGGLVLERHTTIGAVDAAEWDAMFAARGAFDSTGLRLIEDVFATPDRAPDAERWRFNYWLVRGRTGRIVAAAVFTTALWKSDLFSPAAVSAEVERHRVADPRHLTARVVATGTLLTEGDHLYLDRTADWRSALRLLLDAARAEESRTGAAAVVLRDLPDPDPDLHRFLLAQGFARTPAPDSWVREIDFADDAQFLDGLSKKARYHQRTAVLARERDFLVRAYTGGGTAASAVSRAERDHLYRLYRNVHASNLEINVFPLPRRIVDAVLDHAGWELLMLEPADRPGEVVAFAAQHVAPPGSGVGHVQPVFVGLDYRYVRGRGAYQQLLWQTIRSARRHGVGRVLLGMTADLQKARFGAVRQRRWVYTQATELFDTDVLHRLAERLTAG